MARMQFYDTSFNHHCKNIVRELYAQNFSFGGYELTKKRKLELLKRENRGYGETRRLKVQDNNLTLFPIEHLGKNWVRNKFMYAHYA